MAKDPAFLFYPSDWSSGTMLMTREQKGAYIDILMCQFHHGHMTSHDVAQVLGQNDYDRMWDGKLKSKFSIDNEGMFFNERLEIEQLKRKNWCESRNNNKEGKNQYNGHMTSHTTGHMENRNINRNKDDNKTIENQKITFETIWSKYPRPLGKKQAFKHYCASVKTKEEYSAITNALNKYLEWITNNNIEEKFIKHGATWFNNWKDYDRSEPAIL